MFYGSKRKVNLNSDEKLFLENVFKEMQEAIYNLLKIAELDDDDNNYQIDYDGLYFQDLLPKDVLSNTSFSSSKPLSPVVAYPGLPGLP